MNYTINKDLKFKSKNPKIDIKLDNGYILPSRKGEFKINDTIINDITIINKVIIHFSKLCTTKITTKIF